MIEFSPEALRAMTDKQKAYISTLDFSNGVRGVTVYSGGMDLPAGYLYLIIYYRNGNTIHGGLSADGELST